MGDRSVLLLPFGGRLVLEGKTGIRIEPNCQHAELPTSLLLTRAGHGEREGGLVNKKSIGTTGRDKAKAGKEKETGKGREWRGKEKVGKCFWKEMESRSGENNIRNAQTEEEEEETKRMRRRRRRKSIKSSVSISRSDVGESYAETGRSMVNKPPLPPSFSPFIFSKNLLLFFFALCFPLRRAF